MLQVVGDAIGNSRLHLVLDLDETLISAQSLSGLKDRMDFLSRRMQTPSLDSSEPSHGLELLVKPRLPCVFSLPHPRGPPPPPCCILLAFLLSVCGLPQGCSCSLLPSSAAQDGACLGSLLQGRPPGFSCIDLLIAFALAYG